MKTAEGTARFISTQMRAAFMSSWLSKLGALVASGALKTLRARLDPSSLNGAPLLGLNGAVVKSHGGADAKGFANAVKVAADLAQSNFNSEIHRNLQQVTAVLGRAREAAEAAGGEPESAK